MENPEIKWTEEAISNTNDIVDSLRNQWTEIQVSAFLGLLKKSEKHVASFLYLFPSSEAYPGVRKAVIHPLISVKYRINENIILVLQVIDNRMYQE
jgi:plasmid stabilization system protein ParE